MSKKKHPEHVNHERWLVSYADFITLLFAFFVVLFASGQSDKHKKEKMAQAMQAAFAQVGIFEQHAKRPSLDNSAGPSAQPAPLTMPLPTAEQQATELNQKINSKLATQNSTLNRNPASAPTAAAQVGSFTVHTSTEGTTISLHEAGFFASGSATVRPEAVPTLEAIASTLPAGALRVEGHTDNVPIRSALYASNWELSTARAAAIARFLLEHSTLNPQQVAVAGYAEFHPAASNATAEGRAANRRVDLVLVTETKIKQTP